MRPALIAASLALVAGTAAGCGGGAPTDASEEDFCGVFSDFESDAADLGDDPADFVKALKKVAGDLEEVGTPESASDEEREGFEITLEQIDKLEDDASQKDIESIEKDLSEDDKKKVEAFDGYVSETCDSGEE